MLGQKAGKEGEGEGEGGKEERKGGGEEWRGRERGEGKGCIFSIVIVWLHYFVVLLCEFCIPRRACQTFFFSILLKRVYASFESTLCPGKNFERSCCFEFKSISNFFFS